MYKLNLKSVLSFGISAFISYSQGLISWLCLKHNKIIFITMSTKLLNVNGENTPSVYLILIQFVVHVNYLSGLPNCRFAYLPTKFL